MVDVNYLDRSATTILAGGSGGDGFDDNEWGYSNKCLEMVRVVAK